MDLTEATGLDVGEAFGVANCPVLHATVGEVHERGQVSACAAAASESHLACVEGKISVEGTRQLPADHTAENTSNTNAA